MLTAQAVMPTSAAEEKKIFGYEVIDILGQGAGSTIYVVAHADSQQVYALKHVRWKREKDERFFEQLENEFDVSRRFAHPTLRRCIEYKDNHTLFRKATEASLVMELFDGQPLDARHPRQLTAAVGTFIEVARGLGSLHDLGLVHCDLKPSNILVSAEGSVKIIDFGQTTRLGSVKGRIQGTPDFIAPEQVKCEPVTARTDVFNLGATMYWTLTRRSIPTLYTLKKGENSFLVDDRIASPRDIDPGIPEPLSNLVMECIRSNPAKRPPDMNELAHRLEIVQHAISRQAAVA